MAQYIAIDLEVVNSGNKAASAFHWELYLPNTRYQQVAVATDDTWAMPQSADNTTLADGDLYDKYQGVIREPLFPWATTTPVRIRVARGLKPFKIGWRLRYEDGVEPESSYNAPAIAIYECTFDKDYGPKAGGYWLKPKPDVREAGYEGS